MLENGSVVDVRPYSSVTMWTINGTSAVENSLNLDYAYTGGFFSFPVTFNGNLTGGDSLAINGGTFTTVDYTSTDAHDGNVNLDGTIITYTGLSPIVDNSIAVNRTFTLTGGPETITLGDDGTPGNDMSEVTSTAAESVTFTDPTGSLTLDASSDTGPDTINLEQLDSSFGTNVPVTVFDPTSGGSTVNVDATGGGTAYTAYYIIEGGGADTVNVGSAADSSVPPSANNNLSLISGTVQVSNYNGCKRMSTSTTPATPPPARRPAWGAVSTASIITARSAAWTCPARSTGSSTTAAAPAKPVPSISTAAPAAPSGRLTKPSPPAPAA